MTQTRPAPTLQDVALAAGVSTATVSRCLNFPTQVTERTRTRVMETIKTLGYSPNFGARAMAARRTNTVGAIIPTMENAIFARGLQAFQEELRAHGFTLLVASSSYQPTLEEEQIRTLVSRGADALLLIGHHRDPAIYDFLETQDIPALITWAYTASEARPSVGFDNRAAMRSMATEVLAQGHRELAAISSPPATNDRARARLAGIHDAMTAAGLHEDQLRVIETDYGIETGAKAFATLMASRTPPTAVLCGNDVLAVGALRCAQELGLRVPEDISITGFDDIEIAEVAYPALTTVHVPHNEMGRHAAQALVGKLLQQTPITPLELATELKIRASLGPVPLR